MGWFLAYHHASRACMIVSWGVELCTESSPARIDHKRKLPPSNLTVTRLAMHVTSSPIGSLRVRLRRRYTSGKLTPRNQAWISERYIIFDQLDHPSFSGALRLKLLSLVLYSCEVSYPSSANRLFLTFLSDQKSPRSLPRINCSDHDGSEIGGSTHWYAAISSLARRCSFRPAVQL